MTSGIYIRTKEMKRNISKSKLGDKNPMFGKPHITTEETRAKLRVPCSKEKALKIGLALKGNHPSPNKDKTYEEMYGIAKARELKKRHSDSMIGKNKGRKWTKKQRINLSKVHTGRIFSKKHRKNIRLSIIKYNKKAGKFRTRIGKNEKQILDKIEKESKYKIKRNFPIKSLGYFVDGYCKETNTVYEVDEPHHFDVYGNLKERDAERQKQIEEKLNCNFIRIVAEEER